MEHVIDGREGAVGGPDEPKKIEPGMRVLVYGGSIRDTNDVGVVTTITDCDGDLDEYTRQPISIPPRVCVKFDNGSDDEFSTSFTGTGPWDEDAPFQCEDLIVLNNGKKVEIPGA